MRPSPFILAALVLALAAGLYVLSTSSDPHADSSGLREGRSDEGLPMRTAPDEAAGEMPPPHLDGAAVPHTPAPEDGTDLQRLPITVRFVDATTGDEVDGIEWRAWGPDSGGEHAATRADARLATAPRRIEVLTWDARSPPGLVVWTEETEAFRTCRYAAALRATIPVYPEADVVVEVVTHEGSPATGVLVDVALGRDEVSVGRAVRTGANLFRVEQVPLLEGAPLRVTATWSDRDVVLRSSVRRPMRERNRFLLHLPDPAVKTFDNEPIPDPPPGGLIGLGGSVDEQQPDIPGPGALVVRVLCRDGSRAAGARVKVSSAAPWADWISVPGRDLDLRGEARFSALPAGPWTVSLEEPGLVRTSALVDVPEDGEAEIELVERQGGHVDLLVVDEHDRPVPFARITVRDLEWVDIEDGVQRVDRYVNEHGSRLLRNLTPQDHLVVRAKWCGLKGRAATKVVGGATQTLVIQLAR